MMRRAQIVPSPFGERGRLRVRTLACICAALYLIASSQASAFETLSFKDVLGKSHALPEKNAKASVLIFIGVDCPISNRLAPEMGRITAQYGAKGITFYFVYPDKSTKAEEALKHCKDYSLEGVCVIDKEHALVKAAKARVTPQVAIFLPMGELAYTGRINNLFSDHNRPKDVPTKNELRTALADIVAGRKVSVVSVPAIGCGIQN